MSAGSLTRDIAKALYAQSPFHSGQLKSRSDKFWMVSHPIAVDDGGVVPLMKHWGGEVASMWVEDDTLTSPLASIGKPLVIEVSVPMSATRHSYNGGRAVVATFARSRGSIPEKRAFDVYNFQHLPPGAILAVHTEGDASFSDMGRTYPSGFIDVDIGAGKNSRARTTDAMRKAL